MVRISEKDWQELAKKPELVKKMQAVDPVLVQDEAERKRKAEEKIRIDVGTVEDRQSLAYWREQQKEQAEKKQREEEAKKAKAEKKQKLKKDIVSLPGKLIGGALTVAKNKPRASSPARRSTGRKAPAEKRSKPIRFEDREFEMPDFNPPWSR
jgi:hypothetical protein